MYTVSKGPSKIVAKTRRGLSKNYEKFETIREIGKKPPPDINNLENFHVPRPVFQTTKKSYINNKQTEEEVITPQHEEIVNYIHESWNMVVADNPYDKNSSDSNNNSTTGKPYSN
ncbi:FAM195A family protein [Megaselia abdita]